MDIYSDKDVEALKAHIDEVNKKIKIKISKEVDPTIDELNKIAGIVMKFVKSKKRIVYGGTALNMLLMNKDKNDAIYDEYEAPDIDFYSPDPIKDLMDLCDILYKEHKYEKVSAIEAVHQGTYKIHVEFKDAADITYVPYQLYNNMPYTEIDGYRLIHPLFIYIDYFRMLTDPLSSASSGRWEKAIKRLNLMQKHFAITKVTRKLTNPKISDTTHNELMSTIFKTMINKKTLIVYGFEAYNQLIFNSGEKNIKPTNIPYFEVVSTNYEDDVNDIMKILRAEYDDVAKDISLEERYPFFQFYGYNIVISYKNIPLIQIFDYDNQCIPYKTITMKNGTLQIGTFDGILKMGIIKIMRARVENNPQDKDKYYTLVSHLIEIRNRYLSKVNKTAADDTIFSSFVVQCVGKSIDAKTLKRLRIEQNKKHKRYPFSYTPSVVKTRPVIHPKYLNISGNVINKVENLKILKPAK